jgi:3-oxoacyl-[acyl-carrier protein] reductase
MDLGIAGKVAFVMGGSRGIGKAVAQELATAGCRIVVAARQVDVIDRVVSDLRRDGTDAIGISADLSTFAEIDRALDEASANFGVPDIVIFNPPTPGTGSVMELSEADFARAFNDTVLSFMHMVKRVAPHMREKGWGRIVTIGSTVTKQPARGQLGFHYARANVVRLAALAMSKTLAAELGGSGITINTIATGSINSESGTEFLDKMAQDAGLAAADYHAAVFKSTIVGRIGRVEEIASLASYLCSARAAYTTGDNIICDGGMANAVT